MLLAVQRNAIADALNSSAWIFPIAECFHIAALAWSIGMIALVDLCLLGIGIRHSKPSEMSKATELWTLLGLVVVFFSGSVLFLSDPRMYLNNPSFRFKMYALLPALVFHYTVHRKVARSDSSSRAVRIAAGLISLALWISVVFGGLFIAFV